MITWSKFGYPVWCCWLFLLQSTLENHRCPYDYTPPIKKNSFSNLDCSETKKFVNESIKLSINEESVHHTESKFFFWSFKAAIFSAISRSFWWSVLMGDWYLLIMAQAIKRCCSRNGNDEFWMVFEKYLNCLIRAFTASTTHLSFVTCLDWLASDDVNCRRPLRNEGRNTFNPKSSIALIESRKPRSTMRMSSYIINGRIRQFSIEKLTFFYPI